MELRVLRRRRGRPRRARTRAFLCASWCASDRTSPRSSSRATTRSTTTTSPEAIEVKANTILSHPAIRRSIQKIRDMYAEKGYFLAEVESEVVPQKNNEVAVKFTIKEHGQVSVRRITFIGNDNIPDDELRGGDVHGQRGLLRLWLRRTVPPGRLRARHRRDQRALLRPRVTSQVQISTPRVMLTPDRNGIEISITIDEGPRYRIRQLRVYERGPDGHEVEPHRRAPAPAQHGARQARRLLQPRRAAGGPAARSAPSTATTATPTSRRTRETRLDPDTPRGGRHRAASCAARWSTSSASRSAATPRRATR